MNIHGVGNRSLQFSLHNFNKFRHSMISFDMNHPKNSFYQENRKFQILSHYIVLT